MIDYMTRSQIKANLRHSVTVVFGLCLYFFSCISISQTHASTQRLLVMGDSLSAAFNIPLEKSWVSLLEKRLSASGDSNAWEVINASISGETSSGGLARLPDLLRTHEPDIVILELGANDGLQARPTRQIKANLQRMLTVISDSGAKSILIGMQIPDNYGPIYQRSFMTVFSELAADNSQTVLVPFLLENVATRKELMQADGLHPRADAQPLILNNIWPVLEPLVRRQAIQSGG